MVDGKKLRDVVCASVYSTDVISHLLCVSFFFLFPFCFTPFFLFRFCFCTDGWVWSLARCRSIRRQTEVRRQNVSIWHSENLKKSITAYQMDDNPTKNCAFITDYSYKYVCLFIYLFWPGSILSQVDYTKCFFLCIPFLESTKKAKQIDKILKHWYKAVCFGINSHLCALQG